MLGECICQPRSIRACYSGEQCVALRIDNAAERVGESQRKSYIPEVSGTRVLPRRQMTLQCPPVTQHLPACNRSGCESCEACVSVGTRLTCSTSSWGCFLASSRTTSFIFLHGSAHDAQKLMREMRVRSSESSFWKCAGDSI